MKFATIQARQKTASGWTGHGLGHRQNVGARAEGSEIAKRRRREGGLRRRADAAVSPPSQAGFKNPSRKEFAEINLGALQKAVDAGKLDAKGEIDEAALGAAGLFKKRRDGVRLLGNGEVSAKLTLKVTGATKTAVAAIEKAGGSVTVTVGKETPAPESKPAESEPAETKPAASEKTAKSEKAKSEKKAESATGETKEKKTKSEKKDSEDGGSEAPSK